MVGLRFAISPTGRMRGLAEMVFVEDVERDALTEKKLLVQLRG